MNSGKKAFGNKHENDKRQKNPRVEPDKRPVEINSKSNQNRS